MLGWGIIQNSLYVLNWGWGESRNSVRIPKGGLGDYLGIPCMSRRGARELSRKSLHIPKGGLGDCYKFLPWLGNCEGFLVYS